MRKNGLSVVIALTVALLSMTGGAAAEAKGRISFWTTETGPGRMEIQQGLIRTFTKATGLFVEIYGIKGSELAQRVSGAAADGTLPDVLLFPLDYLTAWAEEGILDSKQATSVIDELGDASFSAGPLRLARVEDGWAAVPADGWGQLLLYRKDLFVARGIDAMLGSPETWNEILKAAAALHDPPRLWAIAVGTDPFNDYAQQILEQLALSNEALLIDPTSGKADLNTPEFIQALQFYKRMASFSPPGPISRESARDHYLGGRLAMVIGDPMLLDEIAGLDESAPVILKGTGKPLHEITGIVGAVKGPLGSRPVQWGHVNYFGITRGADPEAIRWVQFLVGEGYLEWLGMAPEEKLSLRPEFNDGWRNLKLGSDRKAAVSELYSDAAISRLMEGVEKLDRWGFASGKGGCIGQLYGAEPFVRLIRSYLSGEMTAESAAERMTAEAVKHAACH